MVRVLLLLGLLVSFGTAFASAAIIHQWRAVKIVTESHLTLDIAVAEGDKGLDHLSVALDGKTAFVPKSLLANLPEADLSTIEVQWGCGFVSWQHPELQGSMNCQNISFKFDDSSDSSPSWYERPTVTFTFSSGSLVDRLINRNVAPGAWSEGPR